MREKGKQDAHGPVVRVELARRTLQALNDLVRFLAVRERVVILCSENRRSLCGQVMQGTHACSWSATTGHSENRTIGRSESVSEFDSDC